MAPSSRDLKTHAEFGPGPGVIAARIKAERERIGLTQRAAAALLGITQSSYKQYECVTNPRLMTLIALGRIGFNLHHVAPELER